MWVGTQEGVAWERTVGNRAAAPLALLSSLEASERRRIKTSWGLLGSVVCELMYDRWAQHGLGRVERRACKTFFVPDWGKLTASGLYNPAQAHEYGGSHPGTR